MKILIITSIYLPHIGGIELYVKNLATGLKKNGNDVSIFVGDRISNKFSDAVEYGIRTIRVPVLYFKGMTYLKRLEDKLLLERMLAKCDVVHLNDVKFLYKFLARKKSVYGYRLFFSSHGFIYHTSDFLLLKNYYMKKMAKYSKFYDINYCVSENDAVIAKKFYFSNIKILIPGTDIHKFDCIKPDIFTKNCFVYWGRVAPNKGILELVTFFHKLSNNYLLQIIGSCDNNGYFQKIISAAEKDKRITFLGYKTDDEIKKYAQRAEFLVFPSLHEGFGMSLIEGLSSGKKIIANNIETFIQILSECSETEYLFDFKEDEKKFNDKLAQLRGKNTVNRPRLEKFSIEFMVKEIEKDYSN